MIFEKICLFIRPSSIRLFACFWFARFVAIMSETGEVIINKDSGNNMENFDASDDTHEEPTILHN